MREINIRELSVTRVTADDTTHWRKPDEGNRLAMGELVPGTRYRIVRWIGEGGMGQVFEALHVDIERPVALKVLQSNRALTPELTVQFMREAQACARVESRFVVDVIDFGELLDGRPFVVMELLGRETVHSLLELGWMRLERAVPILRQCCKALTAIHEAGLVHRDIKAKNIVVQVEDGRADAIRVVDFGLATPIGSCPNSAGTVSHMAPEQIRREAIDARVDIYALGCTAYEMLSRRPPYVDTAERVLDAHLETPPPPITVLRPELPAALDEILLRCLDKQPERRWASAAELEAALVELQISLGFVTAWDDLPMPMVDEPRRVQLAAAMPRANRRPAWVVPVALAVMLATGTGLGLLAADVGSDDVVALDTSVAAEAEADTRIAELTNATRLAASKAYWIYPAGDEPEQATALHWIVLLETELGTVPAHARASQLRAELAGTLTRLGDRYWSEPHGRPFALEFYAMALVFVPDLPLDPERNPLTPVQLNDLINRAEQGRFGAAELRTARVLALLSDDDETRRRERLAAMIDAGEGLSLRTVEQLAKFVDVEPSAAREQPAQADAAESDVGASARSPRNPTRAATLVERARAALARGDRAKARRALHDALEFDSDCVAALRGLAELYFDASEYGKALTHARRAAALEPDDGELLILLGDCYFKTMRYAAARSAYERAATRGHPQAQARLANVRE